VELKGLQLRDSIAFSALWLSQRTFLIAVNSGKPCGKAARLQLRVCGNGYKSIVLVVSRLFFLTVLASGQNPLLSDTYWYLKGFPIAKISKVVDYII